MIRPLLWLTLLASLLLAGCSTVPLDQPQPSGTATNSASTYALPAPRGRGPALVPNGPLLSLTVSELPSSSQVTNLAAPADLWERIRRGFAMPDLDNALADERTDWYARRPDYMQRMTERGSKYLFHVVEELERRNLPLELALLPFIESAFNPQAISSAKAAGMWQFMPATGRDFDLKQNMFRDDRRDVLASTRAALDYLERLYRMFGDWHLALAAYNWGEGSVSRAIKRNAAAGLGTSYTELRMPDETRNYVPKLQAVKNIVAYPERYGARLPHIGNHPFFDTVTLPRDMDVALIARLADVSEKDFRQLNPAANKPVILAAGQPTVLLPWDNASVFERRLKEHKGPWSSWTAWTVPRSMSPTQVAEQHDVSEAELRDINKIPPRMLVKAGSTLLVPRSERHQADVPEHVADNGQVLLAAEVVLKKVMVKARKGDTLAKLAQRHRLPLAQVAQWNGLTAKANLKPGQSLVLHLPQRAARADSDTSPRRERAVKGQARAAETQSPKQRRAAKVKGTPRSTKATKPRDKRTQTRR